MKKYLKMMPALAAAALLLGLLVQPARAQMSLDPPGAHAGAKAEPKVKATLIAEHDGIEPGQAFRVALHQEITPGWHTYWKNPGDTGLPTTLAWHLPDQFIPGELQFPTPSKQPASGLMNFGYQNEVFVLTTITPPMNLKIGDKVTLQGKASWLVCQETCIPESADLSLTLPVVAKASSSAWSSAFTATDKKLPKDMTAAQTAREEGDKIIISVDPIPLPATELPEEAFFYPDDGLLIEHPAAQKLDLAGRKAILTLQKATSRTAPVTDVRGDLWFRNANGEWSYRFTAKVAPSAAAGATPAKKTDAPEDVSGAQSIDNTVSPSKDGVHSAEQQLPVVGRDNGPLPAQGRSGGGSLTFLSALIGAFLGGLILNLMPCVFPVLSLKALGLVQKSQSDSRAHIVAGGFVYTAGVLASFAVLGIGLLVLKAGGHTVGWGTQLQSPVFVSAMALLLFFIGLSLTGAVTIGSRLMGIGGGLAQKSGHSGTFFTGALAVLVATPCTAPFMGGAVFYALTQPWYLSLSVLLMMGLGLALPYLFLTLVPNALRFLPRPGIWMEYFKQFLAFPMFAAAIWLVWVLAQQTGADGVLRALASMLCVALAFWLWKTTEGAMIDAWQAIKRLAAVASFIYALYLIMMQVAMPTAMRDMASGDVHIYNEATIATLQAQHRAVFVDMTASWCITCQVNDKTALSTDKVRGFFKQNDITFLKGDWTSYDPAITAFLQKFDRSGVPIYVFYPASGAAPITLPQILTPDIIINTIQPQLETHT